MTNPIDPELAIRLIIWLGWIMVALGMLKIMLYLIGEIFPSAWNKVKSPVFRKFLTGNGNRLFFGLGGLLTVLLGLGSVGIAILLRYLQGLQGFG